MSLEYDWIVRKKNSGRLTLLYQNPDGTAIDLTGATATLWIYDGAVEFNFDCNIWPVNGQVDLFLSKTDIEDFVFENARFQLIVDFVNGTDADTLLEGNLIVRSGGGPFA